MEEILKILRDLILPVALVALSIYVAPMVSNVDFLNTDFVQRMPLGLLAIALLLSWKFGRQSCSYFSEKGFLSV